MARAWQVTFSFVQVVVAGWSLPLLAAAAQPEAPASATASVHWVAENQARATVVGDVLHLATHAWVTARPAMVDAVVHLRYRTTSAKAEGAVLLRVYAIHPGQEPGVGYRVPLPRANATNASPITAYAAKVRDLEPPSTLVATPAGAWQEAEVRIERSRITVTIGGVTARVVELSGPNAHLAGYVGLQARGDSVEFRDITVTTLPAGRPCVPGDMVPQPDATETAPLPVDKLAAQPPRLLKDAKPNYTPDAMRRRIQGSVMLAAIVATDGGVKDVCVLRGLDPDLDATAAAAGRAFRFGPGTLKGEPVEVRVSIEMSFTLKP